MKKWSICIIGAVLAVVLVSTAALASGHGHGQHTAHLHESCSWSERCARDTDGDGFCDACGRTVASHRDASCAGLCAACSASCADRDGDLVCDHCGRTVHAYVDADGDGVCDHYGANQRAGHHSGHAAGRSLSHHSKGCIGCCASLRPEYWSCRL